MRRTHLWWDDEWIKPYPDLENWSDNQSSTIPQGLLARFYEDESRRVHVQTQTGMYEYPNLDTAIAATILLHL